MAGVEKLLSKIDPTKASGPDNIPCRILKELSSKLAPILTYIFEQSLSSGELPEEWTKANIAPVFKKGSKHLPENYRPVSLTCVCCKLFEHIVAKHILDHLDKHGLLTRLQHGFRRAHSCETQLLLTIHDLLNHRENKTQVDIAVLDFLKAFDTVPHERLLGKLTHYGINGQIHNWIRMFLTTRDQCVVVNGVKSSELSVDSGVPQGTVLGPLLFLLHINDLPDNVTSQVQLFADDCLLYRPINSVADQNELQKDLDSLVKWGETWGMKFNAKKCNIMRMARSRTPLTRMYSLSGHILEEVNQAKYLGLTISNELTWSTHITITSHKANNTLAFLQRNLKSCPPKLKETAYISLVRSVMEYSATIWDPYLVKDINLLERVQRRAARFVKGDYSYRSSVTAMLQDLGWTNLADRRRDLRLALFYKVVNELVAVPTDGILISADNRTRSSHHLKFKHLASNTSQYQHSFFPRTIPQWNSLPVASVEAESLASFKTCLSKAEH